MKKLTRKTHNRNVQNTILQLNRLQQDTSLYGLDMIESELVHNKNLERDPYEGYPDITIDEALTIIRGVLASKFIPVSSEETSKATIEYISSNHSLDDRWCYNCEHWKKYAHEYPCNICHQSDDITLNKRPKWIPRKNEQEEEQ